MTNPFDIPTKPLYTLRQERLLDGLKKAGLKALALNPGPSLVYLTGLSFHLMERPVVAIFVPDLVPIIVLPELEMAKIGDLSFDVRAFPYGEDPVSWPEQFRQALRSAEIEHEKVGVEPTRLRFLELSLLQAGAPQATFTSAEDSLAEMRMRKDAGEIAAMRKAVEIAQEALLATLPAIKAGVSERQIAAELTLELLRHGSEPEMPFSPIVSGGPNSANPHASPSERPLQQGDMLVIDWGATYHGYISDLTRTFAIGKPDAEFQRIAAIVGEANAAGREAAGPGVTASQVDQATRRVIDAAGYGEYFFHRTGHGLGMEGHEAPYIRAGNELILQPGMTFTIEPGIYLPMRNGVRIEDNVVVTEQGIDCLSSLPRQLQVIE